MDFVTYMIFSLFIFPGRSSSFFYNIIWDSLFLWAPFVLRILISMNRKRSYVIVNTNCLPEKYRTELYLNKCSFQMVMILTMMDKCGSITSVRINQM